jgi:thiol peroxidase
MLAVAANRDTINHFPGGYPRQQVSSGGIGGLIGICPLPGGGYWGKLRVAAPPAAATYDAPQQFVELRLVARRKQVRLHPNRSREKSMRFTALLSALTTALLTLSTAVLADEIPVNKGNGESGDGQSVAFKGNPLPLSGKALKVGDAMPSSVLTGAGLASINIADGRGKVRIINVVPSLDTPTCDAQTHELVEKDPNLANSVELVTVSMDLPFAQARWARAAKAKNMTFLSDYKTGEFGMNTGLLIAPLHLLTRTVIVTDKDGIVRYMQVVPEITELPDMAAAMAAAKALL